MTKFNNKCIQNLACMRLLFLSGVIILDQSIIIYILLCTNCILGVFCLVMLYLINRYGGALS